MAKKVSKLDAPLSAGLAAAASVPHIRAQAGETLTVLVDVENISIYYTVTFDKKTLMYSLVDRQEEVVLTPGVHRLGWGFTHVEKEWSHKVSAQVEGGSVQVLDEKSETKKDSPYTIGLAIVEVA